MNFYKKLGEIRPNQLKTTYGPGPIMDAVNDSLTVLDIEYWDTNNIGKEIRAVSFSLLTMPTRL